jgi:DNA-binding cell septation regulator SpoVG
MSAHITVTSMKHLDGTGPTKAFADVAIGGITVMGIRVIDAGKGPFLGMPSSKGKDGKWHDHVTLSKPLAEAVRSVVLAAWRGEPPEGDDGAAPSGEAPAPRPPSNAIHRAGNGKPRDAIQQHIDRLAAEFDRKGPDEEIPF